MYIEDRVNKYLKRQNHPESGDITIRVVHVSDKVVEVTKTGCITIIGRGRTLPSAPHLRVLF
jgi:E1A/CREB-binding protein